MTAFLPPPVAPTSGEVPIVGSMESLLLNINELTIAESEEIEELAGVPLDLLFQPGAKKAKILRCLVFVYFKHRGEPITWEEAGNIKVSALQMESPNPTEAAS